MLGRLRGVDRPGLAVQMITDAGPLVLIDIGANPEVWIKQGDATVHPTRQAATGQPDPVQDPNKAIIHWRQAEGSWRTWGVRSPPAGSAHV